MMLENIQTFKGNVEIEYLYTGIGNNETIIFVHGVGLNLRQFISQHKFFSNSYQVLSVSLRGHGNSWLPPTLTSDQFSIKNHTNDLMELIEELQINKFHYVGNSAGGLIGYQLYNNRPDLFSSLTTFGTTAELKLPNFMVKLVVFIDKMMLKLNKKGYLRFVSKNSSKIKAVQEEIYNYMIMTKNEGIYYFRKNIGNYSFLNILSNINVPVLLIKGEYDNDINRSLKSTEKTLLQMKNAKIVELERAGHIANMDMPKEFNDILKNFFKDK